MEINKLKVMQCDVTLDQGELRFQSRTLLEQEAFSLVHQNSIVVISLCADCNALQDDYIISPM